MNLIRFNLKMTTGWVGSDWDMSLSKICSIWIWHVYKKRVKRPQSRYDLFSLSITWCRHVTLSINELYIGWSLKEKDATVPFYDLLTQKNLVFFKKPWYNYNWLNGLHMDRLLNRWNRLLSNLNPKPTFKMYYTCWLFMIQTRLVSIRKFNSVIRVN